MSMAMRMGAWRYRSLAGWGAASGTRLGGTAIILNAMPSSAQRQPVDPGDYGPGGRSAWLDVDWRAHQRWVTVGGRPVNVVELGSGPAVVFVHGLSGSWQNWLEQLPVFARDHRVIALDLPGFGASPMPAQRISIPGYGRLVAALLDELGIDHAAIVGNSMGGLIGAEMAIAFPSRVERLTLVSAAGLSIGDLRNESALAVLRKLDRRLAAYAAWLGTRSSALTSRPRARHMVFRLVAHRPELLSGALVAEQVRSSGKPGFVAALDALTDYPIRDRLGEIACPVLIVWGAKDLLVPVRDAHDFERLIPNSRKVVWPDTGHMAMLERPAAFNALLTAFLDEEPGERVGAAPAGAAAGKRSAAAKPAAPKRAAAKPAAPKRTPAKPAKPKRTPAKPAKPKRTPAKPAKPKRAAAKPAAPKRTAATANVAKAAKPKRAAAAKPAAAKAAKPKAAAARPKAERSAPRPARPAKPKPAAARKAERSAAAKPARKDGRSGGDDAGADGSPDAPPPSASRGAPGTPPADRPARGQRSVTAPSEALLTSAAYLASTPVRSGLSGRS
jgi:pimeloyl-ACP methyl ester carboxylesterase